ncbi:hypothetical protein CLIM01_06248 [Colletotrichum limetticola]|uniref:Uncharacterized protein n=1 Tax=Colletotrichum limetticola TaxID=1209924 RepID=A0ABQ9PY54_9PEZI|nr:hypothetical protein CLIM01_06248 [Colletotrichum limetticola]
MRNPSVLNPLALNEQEGRAYQFFQIIGAPTLSSGFECEFWGKLVLQLANADNAIFHATVALGLLLEDMHNWPISWPVPRTAPPTERTAMALRHYQTALQQLFVPLIRKDSASIISLASAVVFSCIETLCGNAHNAMKLTSLGTSILTQLEVPSSSPSNSERLAPFVSVFVRLDSYTKELLQTEDHIQPKPPPFRHAAASSCPYADLLCDVDTQEQEEPQYTYCAAPVVGTAC